MLIGDVRPSTLDGVKSLAAQLRKQQGLKHSTALDLAAKAANCANFKHALNNLPARGVALERPYVLLTIYWCDRDRRYEVGRETLRIDLARPLLETASQKQLKLVRGFGGLRMVAPDHFICDRIAQSQSYARDRLCTAERSLRFMEHTGLRPTRAHHRAHPDGHSNDQLPNKDHATKWIDPTNDQFILVDEPYRGVPDEAERAAWAERNGWIVTKTAWPGMYNPHKCDLYVATDAGTGYDLDALVTRIQAMPPPTRAEAWVGESSSSWDTFVSPMAKTPQDLRRARCPGMIYPVATKTTLPYHFAMGETRRRPAGNMSVEGHIAAGSLLKALLWSRSLPDGAHDRLDSARSQLEDWMAIEVGQDALQGPEFFDVYYHETKGDVRNLERARLPAGKLEMIDELKRMLQLAYPNCGPLRQMLHRIDMAAKLISRMKKAG